MTVVPRLPGHGLPRAPEQALPNSAGPNTRAGPNTPAGLVSWGAGATGCGKEDTNLLAATEQLSGE